jgi:hypothetical protein
MTFHASRFSRYWSLVIRHWPGLVFLLLGAFASGCRSFPPPENLPPRAKKPQFIYLSPSNAIPTVVAHVPSEARQFSLCQELNPIWWLGNADDPAPPDWYRPGQFGRNVMWYFRNPFHNVNFFVIGVSDRPFIRSGRFPRNTFNPDDGWNWSVIKYYRLRFPFVSYKRNRVRIYFGWRTGGAFGIELKLRATERSSAPKAPPKEGTPEP